MSDTRFVLDASVVVKWLNQDRELHTAEAKDILERAMHRSLRCATSDLAVHEVMNALIRGKGIRGRALEEAVDVWHLLPLERIFTSRRIAARAALIAEQYRITFYDAVYLAVASERELPLITANPKHQKAVAGVTVIALEDWFHAHRDF